MLSGPDSLLLAEWRSDSLGCKGKRSFETPSYIVDQYSLEGRSVDVVVDLFGPPDSSADTDEIVSLFYYTWAACHDGELVPDTDLIFVSFQFSSGELENVLAILQ